MSTRLAPLSYVPPSELDHLETPVPRIKTEEDVKAWRTTSGYDSLRAFIAGLAEACVGRELPLPDDPKTKAIPSTPAVDAVLRLLDELEGWIAEIPPRVTPQRFGNLAFRTWGTRLDERLDDLLHMMLGEAFAAVEPLVKPYLLQSFGSFVRLDYGTGHEAAFVLFLLCLALVRFFPLESLAASSSAVAPHPASNGAKLALDSDEREWTAIALVLFPRYLMLCWRLQDTYSLEPAGSQGVWGLDDHHFIGYILGAAQLRDQTVFPPSSALLPSLPPTNLYFLQIQRIRQYKSGPFQEHSAQIAAIATSVPRWSKVYTGLVKMYEGEVLGKRVVVQHLPLGGLIKWDPREVDETEAPPQTTPGASRPVQAGWELPPTQPRTRPSGTGAPWALASTGAGSPISAPWAGASAPLTSAPWAVVSAEAKHTSAASWATEENAPASTRAAAVTRPAVVTAAHRVPASAVTGGWSTTGTGNKS